MILKLLIIISIFFGCSSINAQALVTDSLQIVIIKGKSFDFVFRVDTVHEFNKYINDSMHYFNVYAIEIYHSGAKSYTPSDPTYLQQFQTHLEFLELWQYNEVPVRLIDANFDGYEDIELLDIPGMYWNTYQYYIYDPSTNRFIEDPFLIKLTDPTFYPDQKYIHYSWHIGPNEFGHAVYKWDNHILLLIGKEVQSYDEFGDADNWSYHAEKRVNGNMIEVEYVGSLDFGLKEGLGPCSIITHGHSECDLYKKCTK